MDNRPIGVFDSGLGGLTGVRELRKRLPHEDIIYFGDTGRVPYGSRSPETILQYARQDVAFLLSKNVKCIMAACGTVSSTYPAAEAAQLRQIVRESENMDAYSGDFIRSYLKLLLLSVLRDTGSEKKRLKTPVALNHENEIVSRTLQYVADHVCDKLSVEIVSREVGVSASHLTALFHRQMNISPGEYIRRVKLEESKRLIREGTMNFSQIAAQLNYSTIHHFSRQFKDKFGMSPSEYAKSIQSE